MWSVAAELPSFGVTSFLPTLISDGFDRAEEALEILATGPPSGWRGARPLGLHLEGPWLHPNRVGAHALAALRDLPHPSRLPDHISAEAGVRLVTLAPELPGGHELIRELRRRGIVVSCGHTTATADQARAAFAAGASMGTHLFNAMSGLHHRDPGLAAALLADKGSGDADVAVGLIADGHHVAPEMIALAWRLAADRIVLVSDAISLLGTTEQPVGRRSDGTLLGATMGLDACVRNVVAFTGAALTEVVPAASSRPQDVVGSGVRSDDWIELTESGSVVRSIIGGVEVFRA